LRVVPRALATRSTLQGAPRPVFVPDGAKECFRPPAGQSQWDALTKRTRSARSRPALSGAPANSSTGKVEAVDPERGVAEPPGSRPHPSPRTPGRGFPRGKPEGVDGDKVAAKLAPHDDSP
jgi:hypothetical protein